MGSTSTEVISAPPAPSASETAADISEARLKYDPLMAAQSMQLQQQYMPQQTALQSALAQQYTPQLSQMLTDIQKTQMPQLQALQAQLFPQQTQVLEAGAGQALQGLQSPQAGQLQQAGLSQALSQLQQPQSVLTQQLGTQAQAGLAPNALAQTAEQQALQGMQQTPLQQAMTQQALQGLTPTGLSPEQQAAIDAIRGRQMTEMERGIRGSAQMGGGLYGGRRESREDISRQQMGQQFAAEDVNRLLAQQQQAMAQAQGVYGMTEQARQNQLSQLYGAAQLQPNLTQQAMQTGMGVSGLQAQNQQQALQNAFAAQQQMMQQAQPFLNILYPQAGTQQAQVSPFSFQSAVPDANAQLNAVAQLLGQKTVVPGQASPFSFGWSAKEGLSAGYQSSERYKENIKLWGKPSTYLTN